MHCFLLFASWYKWWSLHLQADTNDDLYTPKHITGTKRVFYVGNNARRGSQWRHGQKPWRQGKYVFIGVFKNPNKFSITIWKSVRILCIGEKIVFKFYNNCFYVYRIKSKYLNWRERVLLLEEFFVMGRGQAPASKKAKGGVFRGGCNL